MEATQHKTANRAAMIQPAYRKEMCKSAAKRKRCSGQKCVKISSPHDPAEREADETARKVMRMAVPESTVALVRNGGSGAFRSVKSEEKEKKLEPKLVSPYIARFADSGIISRQKQNEENEIQRQVEDAKEEEEVQRQAEGQDEEQEVDRQAEDAKEEEEVQRQAEEQDEEQEVDRQAEDAKEEEDVQRQAEEQDEEQEVDRQAEDAKEEEEVQRQAEEQDEDREEIHRKSYESSLSPKCRGYPLCANDKKEEKKVQTKPILQRQVEEEDAVQKQSEEEDESVQACTVQRRGDQGKTLIGQPRTDHYLKPLVKRDIVREAIHGNRVGEPLLPEIRGNLEAVMGVDLGDVRVHRDSFAQEASAAINAKAFTYKNNIWLGKGQSQSNLELMAHEATHVVQQTSRRKAPETMGLTRPREIEAPKTETEKNIGPVDTHSVPVDTPAHENPEAPSGKPAVPQESKALNAVDTLLPGEPRIEDAEGLGENAGVDDPAMERPPIDEDPGTSMLPREKPVADTAVQRKSDGNGFSKTAQTNNLTYHTVSDEIARSDTGGRNSAGSGLPLIKEHGGMDPGNTPNRPYSTEGMYLFKPDAVTYPPGAGSQGVVQDDVIQRQAEGCPPPDAVPETEVISSPSSPAEDPAFQQTEQRADNRAASQSRHGTGEDKSASANAAADVTEGEKKSHAQKDQVGKMDAQAQNPPVFDKQGFINKVLDEVRKTTPQTLDAFLKFADSGKVEGVKAAVTGKVKESQKKSQGPLHESAQADPGAGQSPRTAIPLQVESPGMKPQSIRADRAMPPPKTKSEIDFRAETVQTENILKEVCVDRAYMDKHNDPELKAGAEAQDNLKQASDEAPQKYRAEEASTLAGARVRASHQGLKGVGDLFDKRSEKFDNVGTKQEIIKTDNEKKRINAARNIEGIFTSTQTMVQNRLKHLDTEVGTTFDREAGKASQKFQDFVREKAKSMEKSWIESLAEMASDILFGPPPRDAEAAFESGRRTFVQDLNDAIEKIADIVERGLSDARDIVENGKSEVQKELDKLGDELEAFKQEKSEVMNDRFRGLEVEISRKKSEIIKGLANRYVKTLKSAKEAEKRIRDEYKNIVDRARDAYNDIKDAVLGWIDKLASVVGGAARRIVREPGKFLSNLGQGIIQGFTMFMGNIGENIKGAVVQWLTGTMGAAGIQLPTSFDARGIIGFLMELVGLGVANIKMIARKVFGHRAVSLIEKGVAGAEKIKRIFDILASEGPAGLFKYLQSEFERIKEKVLGEVGNAVAEGLVVAGIKKVLGIISGLVSGGVGTVITIVMTIIDVIMWIRSNASQLAELVSTIAGMATAVLQGQVAALAGAINNVLKRLLPLVLGFLGALLGIGKIVQRIQKIFKAIRRPATKAITSLFKGLKKLVRKILKKLGIGKKGSKKNKGKLLSPRKVVQLVMRKMKMQTRATSSAAALSEKRAQAQQLIGEFQPRLEKGRLKITITDRTPQDVEEDADVDFVISASPGTRGRSPVILKDEKARQKRFSIAKSLKKFEDGFNRGDWSSHFNKLSASTHSKDIRFGLANKIIYDKGSKYVFYAIRTTEIINRGAAKVQSSGPGYPPIKNGPFGVPIIQAFLTSRKVAGVPPGTYKERKIVEEVVERVESAGVIKKADKPGTWVLEENHHRSDFAIFENGNFVLKRPYRKVVRKTFYGSGYEDAVYEWKKDELKVLKNKANEYIERNQLRRKLGAYYYFPDNNQVLWKLKGSDREEPTIEHKKSVVEHWLGTGHSGKQRARANFFNKIDDDHMEIMPRSVNSSLGARMKERYGIKVGKGFRGPGEDNL